MSAFAPKAHLTAIVDDWSGYYIRRVKEAMDGSWKTGDVWGGIKDGMVKLAPYNASMSPAAREAADAVQKRIVDGSLHPFTGELKDQKGVLRLKAGETAVRRDAVQDGLVCRGRAGLSRAIPLNSLRVEGRFSVPPPLSTPCRYFKLETIWAGRALERVRAPRRAEAFTLVPGGHRT